MAIGTDVKAPYYILGADGNYHKLLAENIAEQIEGVGRRPATAYEVGDVVASSTNNKGLLLCTQAGTTAETDLNIASKNAGDVVTDGTVTWEVIDRRITFNNLPNKPTTIAGYGITDAGLPVGHEFFTTNPNIPAGCIPLLGGEYSRTAYADLWAWVQAQAGYLLEESAWQAKAAANGGNVPFYSKGDGTTTFRVPALKCWVKGASSISEVGGYLAAGLPDIDTNVYIGQDGRGYPNGSADSTTVGHAASYPRKTKLFRASDYNTIYGTSATVQPPSIVGLWVVKAYGAVTNVGSTDVANIATGLTSLETRFSTDVTPIRLGGTGATTAYDARNNLGVDIDVLLADATLLWQNPKPTSAFNDTSMVLSQPYTNFKRLLFITSVASNGYTFVSAGFINVDVLSANIELARNNGWTYVTYMVGVTGSGIHGDISEITTTKLQYSTRSGLRPQFIYGYK